MLIKTLSSFSVWIRNSDRRTQERPKDKYQNSIRNYARTLNSFSAICRCALSQQCGNKRILKMRIKYLETTHTRHITLNFSTGRKTLSRLIKLQQMGSQFGEYVLCCARFKAAGDQFISATVPTIKSSANHVEIKAWLKLCASKTKDPICVILQKQQDTTCMFLFKQRTVSLEIPAQTQMWWLFFSCFSLHTNDWLWGCFHVVITDFIRVTWSWCSRSSGSYFPTVSEDNNTHYPALTTCHHHELSLHAW